MLVGQVSIPPMSEMHVQGRLEPKQPDLIPDGYDGIFEPTLQEHHSIAGARSVNNPQNGLILLRLVNTSQDKVDLPANITLGHFHSLTSDPEEEYQIFEKVIAATQELRPTLPVDDMLANSDLTKDQYEMTKEVLHSYADVFSSSQDDIGQADVYHTINTTTDTPIRQRAYRTSPTMRIEIQRQVDDLLKRGIIEESHSPWFS